MTERLLQFIWQFQYFNRHDLSADDGAVLQVIHPGKYNTHQGPDFLEATVRIGNTLLAGSVELHLNTSDWNKHGHQYDPNYKNVVLHVVWQHDGTNTTAGLPVLELQHRVSGLLLNQYDEWLRQAGAIACAGIVKEVKDIVWIAWKERLLVERLQRKTNHILQLLQQNIQHWEATCWQMLASNFGMPVNAEAFESIAQSLPVALLAKHKNQLPVLEALLLGQAGLLEGKFEGTYENLLQREYHFHQHKYALVKPAVPVHFLRMRPAAFPTVRLAQLAALVHRSSHFFAAVKEAATIKQLYDLLQVSANDYWHYHYRLDERAAYKIKSLGKNMANNIIINTVVPVVFAYGVYHNEQALKNKAILWLQQVAAEENSITKNWQLLGIGNEKAADSQALIELKTQYCDAKRCLDCAAGNALLKRNC